ncbi:hypothetical protein B0H14DRAFT_2629840, partial [Mycena olivaceomarginata]
RAELLPPTTASHRAVVALVGTKTREEEDGTMRQPAPASQKDMAGRLLGGHKSQAVDAGHSPQEVRNNLPVPAPALPMHTAAQATPAPHHAVPLHPLPLCCPHTAETPLSPPRRRRRGGGGDGGVGDAKKADCVFGGRMHRVGAGRREARGRRWRRAQVKAGATGGGDEQEAEKTALEACRNGRQQTGEMPHRRKHPDIEAPHQLLFWSSKCTPGRRPEAKEQAEYGEARAQSNPRWIQPSAYDQHCVGYHYKCGLVLPAVHIRMRPLSSIPGMDDSGRILMCTAGKARPYYNGTTGRVAPESVHGAVFKFEIVQKAARTASRRQSEEAEERPNEGPEWPEASGAQFAQKARTGEHV